MALLDRIKHVGVSVVRPLAQQTINNYVAEHRAELIEALERCQVERGRAWLNALCDEYPIAAGFVTLAMRGTPEQAIVSIAIFDEELARELAQHIDVLKQLQAAWNAAGTSEV